MPVAGWALDDAQPAVELADLRLFVVLAEELHFGRAAARLHLSQPGLSYRFKALEQALGYQVLARNRRGVRLTPAGEAVLGGARRLLGEAHRVVDDGSRVARGELATVRAGFAVIALPAEHPLARRDTVALADLAGEAFVLFPRELGPQTYCRALLTGAARRAA